ncbi:MAG: TolC family protein [Bacteroidetes bacterium]|nr:TolC family protein [Bacteroidota bacterium]
MRPKHIFSILFISACMTQMNAQTSNAPGNSSFTLQQAVDYAMKNSPNYLNAELDVENATYRRKELLGAGLPQLSASLDVKDYIEIPTSLIPAQFFGGPPGQFAAVKFGTKYNATGGGSISQLIFSSDYIVGLKAAKEFINLSRISVYRGKSELTASVAKAYYNVLVNKERIKLLDANIVRLKKLLDDTRAFNDQGFVEKIDVERLEVQYNNLLTEKEKTDRLIGLSETMLKFQMGYKMSDAITLSDTLAIDDKEITNISGSKIDVTKRPDYQLLQSQQKLYKIDIKRQRLGYLPTIAAYGSYNYNAQRQQFDFTDGSKSWYKIALIGGTINLSLFDGLQRHNRIQQAKIAALKGENNIKSVQMLADMEASVSEISYTNAYSTLLTQKKNMELAQHVYDVAQKKYTQGVGSNIEVVTAETSLKEAQTNYYNAVYDMLVARIDYQKAAGTLVK